MTDAQTGTDENRGSHVTRCLFCTDSKICKTWKCWKGRRSRGEMEKKSRSRGEGEGMRGGETARGNGLTVS